MNSWVAAFSGAAGRPAVGQGRMAPTESPANPSRPNPDPSETTSPGNAPKIRTMNTQDSLPMSRIAQLMEQAAARLLRPRLADGETSLTLSLNLTHMVTGPISGNLRSVATYQGASGRADRFLVHVFDESGLVASAEHRRAIAAAR